MWLINGLKADVRYERVCKPPLLPGGKVWLSQARENGWISKEAETAAKMH